ncbi:MAG: hypothetical protein NXH85_13260 [Pseudomonadaceae bacterium]|nr:hypothetical protein [Pseudomonadaceae bacterium]
MHSIEAFYFGVDDALFGTYTPAEGIPKRHGVLICQPLLQEFYKTHFALRRTAVDLAAKGYDVLRFDYVGTGDSQGDCDNVANWVDNVATAMTELTQLAGTTSNSVIAVRFGAALLSNLPQPIEKLILWDPIMDGAAYMDDARAAQQRLVRKHRDLDAAEIERFSNNELIGASINPALTQSIAEHRGQLPQARETHCVLSADRYARWLPDSAQQLNVESQCPWEDADLRMLYPHDVITALESTL